MPVDSIITTIITSVMVRIRNASNCGMPKWKGSTTSNQAALPTFSKVMRPMTVATAPPITMPSSTEMLATKPLANLTMSRIDTSTSAEMPTPLSSAYFGFGTVGTIARPLGTGGMAEPGEVTSASHLA